MSTSAADSHASFETAPTPEPSPSKRSAAKTPADAKTPNRSPSRSSAGTFWLDGDVLACACPACGAPMTIRLWLMMADCWRCSASLELTEEQEREALELLALLERESEAPPRAPRQTSALHLPAAPGQQPTPAKQPAAAIPPLPVEKPAPAEQPAAKLPAAPPGSERSRPRPAEARRAPTPGARTNAPPSSAPSSIAQPPVVPTSVAPSAPARTRSATTAAHRSVLDDVEQRGHGFWKDLPALLISLVVHLVAMLLLGMWTFEERVDPPALVLTVELGPEHRDGGLVESELEINENDFDLPIDKEPTTKQEKEALVRANEDARELRLDADDSSRALPPVARVKADLVSNDPYKRMHAARDPRVRSAIVSQEGGTTLTEAAVARGLRWIGRHQNENGSWSLHGFGHTRECQGQCQGHGGVQSDAGATALALMAMLGAGQTHTSGMYRDQVSRGLRWLIEHQKPNGDLRANSAGHSGMYAHGQAAIVLCDAFKLTGDESLRAPAQLAIDFICEAQHPQGGWRYSPGEPGDLSVVGWQLMAMHSAKSAYLNVPKKNQNQAMRFLDLTQADKVGGLYGYLPRSGPTPTMTAEGLLCRMYLGWDGSRPGLKAGVEHLIEHHLPNANQRNMYYWYYGAQVMHHWGGTPWETWNTALREALVTTQETSGHAAGSWSPHGDPHGGAGGRLYVTALATCTLEVYYRYAPLYRRIKLD